MAACRPSTETNLQFEVREVDCSAAAEAREERARKARDRASTRLSAAKRGGEGSGWRVRVSWWVSRRRHARSPSRCCRATAGTARACATTTHLELKEHEINALIVSDEGWARSAVRPALRCRAVRARFRRIPHVGDDHGECALALRQRRRPGAGQYCTIQREQHRSCYPISVQLVEHRSHLARLKHRGDNAASSRSRQKTGIILFLFVLFLAHSTFGAHN